MGATYTKAILNGSSAAGASSVVTAGASVASVAAGGVWVAGTAHPTATMLETTNKTIRIQNLLTII